MVKSVRICLVGSSSGSGTTSAIIHYIHGSFPQNVPTTCDPAPLPFAVHKSGPTSSQTSKETIHLIICDERIKEVSKYPNTPIALMGCKTDLRDDPNRAIVPKLTVSPERGKSLASEFGAFKYFDTSALRGTGIKKTIETCVLRILNPPKKFLWWAVKTSSSDQSRIERLKSTKTPLNSETPAFDITADSQDLNIEDLIDSPTPPPERNMSPNLSASDTKIRKSSIDASVHADGWTEISWHSESPDTAASPGFLSPILEQNMADFAHKSDSVASGGKSVLSPDSDPHSHIRIVGAELERLSSNLQQEQQRFISFLKTILDGITDYLITKYRYSKHKLEIALQDAAEIGNDPLFAKLQAQICHLIFPSTDVILTQFLRLKINVPQNITITEHITCPMPTEQDIINYNPPSLSSGNTPLHIATLVNKIKIVQVILYGPYGLLTPAGAQCASLSGVNHLNFKNQTARDLAIELGKHEIFKLLSDKKALAQPTTGNITQNHDLDPINTLVSPSPIGTGTGTGLRVITLENKTHTLKNSLSNSFSLLHHADRIQSNQPLESEPLESPLIDPEPVRPLESPPLSQDNLNMFDMLEANIPLEAGAESSPLQSPHETLDQTPPETQPTPLIGTGEETNEPLQPLETDSHDHDLSPTNTPSPGPNLPPMIATHDYSSPILSINLPGSGSLSNSLTSLQTPENQTSAPTIEESPDFIYQRAQWQKFRKIMDDIGPFFGISKDTIGMRDPKEIDSISENSPLAYSDHTFVPQGNFDNLLKLFSTIVPVPVSGSQSFELLGLVETLHKLRQITAVKRSKLEKKLVKLYKSFRNQAATLSFESGRLGAKSFGSDGPTNILFLSAYPYASELDKLDNYQNEITHLANQLAKAQTVISFKDVFPESQQKSSDIPQIQLLALHVKERSDLANKILPSLKDTLSTCKELRALAQFSLEQMDNLVNTLNEKFSAALALEQKAHSRHVPRSPRRFNSPSLPRGSNSPDSGRKLVFVQPVPFPVLTNARDASIPNLIEKAKTVLNNSLKPILRAESKLKSITDSFSSAFQQYISTTLQYQGKSPVIAPNNNTGGEGNPGAIFGPPSGTDTDSFQNNNDSVSLQLSTKTSPKGSLVTFPNTELPTLDTFKTQTDGTDSLNHFSGGSNQMKTQTDLYEWQNALLQADISEFTLPGENFLGFVADPDPLVSANLISFDAHALPSLEETWSFIQQIVRIFINEVRSYDLPEWENLQEFVSELLSHIEPRFRKYNEDNLPPDKMVISAAKNYATVRKQFWEFEDEFFLLDSKIRVAKRRSQPLAPLLQSQSIINTQMIQTKSELSTLQSTLFSFAHHGRPEILAILPTKTFVSPLFDPARSLDHYQELVPIRDITRSGESQRDAAILGRHDSHSVFLTRIKPSVSTVITPIDGEVVLKRYNLKDPVDRNSFDRELACFEILSHPFLANLTCVFTDADGEYAYTEQPKMAYSSITAWSIDTEAQFSHKIRILQDLFVSVSYIHSRGLVHGDLTPTNILIDDQNRPRITDFDAARAAQFINDDADLDDDSNNGHQNKSKSKERAATRFTSLPTILLGHPDANQIDHLYASPELSLQIQMGDSEFSCFSYPTDMWSISATALSIFSENPTAFQLFLSDKDPSHISEMIPIQDDSGQKSQLIELFSRLLSTKPGSRPSAAEALAHPLFASNPLEDIDINLSEVIDVSSVIDDSVAPVSDKNILMSGATRWKLFKNIFEDHTSKLRNLHGLVTKEVTISRDDVVNPLLKLVSGISNSDCHNLRIKIKFKGEPSIDAGGPGREGLTLFFGASPIQQINRGDESFAASTSNDERIVDPGIFHKKYKLFETNQETGKCLPISTTGSSSLSSRQSSDFTAFGKMLGICLINGFTVTDLPLVVPAFYRILWYGVDHIRTHPKSWQLKHLEAFSGKLSGLRQIMAWKDAEMLESCGFSFIPRGSTEEVDVTMENRSQYFQNYIWDSLVRQRIPAWKAIRSGFLDVLTHRSINDGKFSGAMMALCGPTDIALLLGASGHVDVELFIKQCLYIERSGWSGSPQDPNYTPNLLLDWMRTTSQANLQKFLFFITASTSLPNNPRSSTVRKAIFKCSGSQKNRLPAAATCSLTLKCPDYRDKQMLAAKLEEAILCDDFGNR